MISNCSANIGKPQHDQEGAAIFLGTHVTTFTLWVWLEGFLCDHPGLVVCGYVIKGNGSRGGSEKIKGVDRIPTGQWAPPLCVTGVQEFISYSP